MKISGETLQVLKNFASINTNIVFKPGDTIATISSAKNIFARAKIKEELPNQFAIYDLNSLLAMISLVDDQEVKFEDNKLSIVSASGMFEYFYSNPEVVTAAPDVAIDHEAVYKFKLTAEDIQMILKAAAITNAPTVSVSNKEQSVTIKVGDRKNDSSNSFQKVIGSAFDDFDVFVAVENLKVPFKCDVALGDSWKNGKAKFLHFKHESKELQYWIAAEPGSNV